MNEQLFFSNQPISLYSFLLEKIRDCCHTPYSQDKLSLFIGACHHLLEQYTQSGTQPEKIMALYFMQAEFLTRFSLLAIDKGEGKEAYRHYERANYVLSAAAEYHRNLTTEQNYRMNNEQIKEIKNSNSEGFTNPIAALVRIKQIIDPQLTPLLQQTSKLDKTT